MKPEVKQLWLDALRSGKYKQALRALRTDHGFCCLGVLCDVHAAACGGEWRGRRYMGQGTRLPRAVREWAGLTHSDPKTYSGFTLADLNDGAHPNNHNTWREYQSADFRQIADIVEAEL